MAWVRDNAGGSASVMAMSRQAIAAVDRLATQGATSGGARAFTLLEAVLCVALIGLLIALAAPSLSRVRERGWEAASTATMRSHAGVLASYADKHRGVMPYLTSPTATYSIIRWTSGGFAYPTLYFGSTMHWNLGLADGYYASDARSRAFKSPFLQPRRDGSLRNSYHIPCVFYADPRFYDPTTRETPPAQRRPVRLDEVLFPSEKAALLDDNAVAWFALRGRARSLAAFVDGSAAPIPHERAGPQMETGDGSAPTVDLGHPSDRMAPLRHALHGVRGRDLPR